MLGFPLLKAGYFTDHTIAKAGIAGLGAFTYKLTESICGHQIGAGFCGYVSWLPDLVLVLLGLQALDLLTGTWAARASGDRVESRRLGTGISRKLAMLTLVAAALGLEVTFRAQGLELGGLLYRWTASWFVAVEVLSLYENADRMGMRLPTRLREMAEWGLERTPTVDPEDFFESREGEENET